MSGPVRNLLPLAVALGLCGCGAPNPLLGGYPADSVIPKNVSRSHPELFGLQLGRGYRLLETHEFYAGKKGRVSLERGTTVRMKTSRRWQTITHGYEYWVAARILSGPHAGATIRVYKESAALFSPIS